MSARVNVLLATYNGGRFLRDQLDSVSSQAHAPYRVTVRDDGSTDATLSILSEWAAGRPKVSVSGGPRLGAARSFLTLLADADESCDYFAFCDQDDVWLPHKIGSAVTALGECCSAEPIMYFSRVEIVDVALRHLGYSRVPRRVGFANALVENVAIGCTMVLNRRAREVICEKLPNKVAMHDWWCHLVVSGLGKVIFDERPSVRYRQHGRNVFGGASSQFGLFRHRFSRFLKLPRDAKLLGNQAEELRECFGEALRREHKVILERFLRIRGNLWARLSYSAAMDVWRQNWVDTTILRAMILLGRA